MYVRNLKENMLLKPISGNWIFNPVTKEHSDAYDSNKATKAGVSGDLMVGTSHTARLMYGATDYGQTPAIYLFSRTDKWIWAGVYKHHYLLIEGYTVIVDGYQFSSIEPVK